jgi:hypothetical protein
VLALAAGVSLRSSIYLPRRPEQQVLHQIVREHFETLRGQVGTLGGEGLPSFVEREFRQFLTCGCLAAGFARFRCAGCRHEQLVAFSCKGRGFCPSCGGRRMTERAAHLVDHVFPDVPVRQWVLTLPPRLRYLLAWDHALCRAVVAVYVRAIDGWLRRRARRADVSDGRSGSVAVLQRFGSALNLNVHIHALVLDGVFADADDGLRFYRTPPAEGDELARLLRTIERRVGRVLAKRGIGDGSDGADTPDPLADEAPALAGLAAASAGGVIALGPRAGARLRRWGRERDDASDPIRSPWRARLNGFDLHAGIAVPGTARDRLERLCRYALRPAVGQQRLAIVAGGAVSLELRHPWRDGTTHILFEPVELLERLAALTPRPRVNLLLYHGVLAPRAAWRRRIVPAAPPGDMAVDNRPGARANPTWADLMRRSFGFDVLACPRCPGRLRLIALIQQPAVVQRILRHLGLSTDVPVPLPSRAPPRLWDSANEVARFLDE